MASSLEVFAPIARRIRLQRRIVACGFAIFFLSALAGSLLGKNPHPLIFIGAGVGLLILIVGLFSGPGSVSCPECNGQLKRADGNYCPECGARSLSEGDWFHPRACAGCGQVLRYSKGGRRFKFRHCTYCGSHLDPEGF